MNAVHTEAGEAQAVRRIQEEAAALARSESPIVADTATMIEALAYNLLRHLGEDARPLLLDGAGGRTDA